MHNICICFAHLSLLLILIKRSKGKFTKILSIIYLCVKQRKGGKAHASSIQWYDDVRSLDTNLNIWSNTVKHALEICT